MVASTLNRVPSTKRRSTLPFRLDAVMEVALSSFKSILPLLVVAVTVLSFSRGFMMLPFSVLRVRLYWLLFGNLTMMLAL